MVNLMCDDFTFLHKKKFNRMCFKYLCVIEPIWKLNIEGLAFDRLWEKMIQLEVFKSISVLQIKRNNFISFIVCNFHLGVWNSLLLV